MTCKHQDNYKTLPHAPHVSSHVLFYGERLSAPRLTTNLKNRVSVFMTSGDRVAQIYPKAFRSSGPVERHCPYSQ